MTAADGPTTSIIVVSYNTRDLTLDCLESVYAETQAFPFEVIVVDNASTDGSADAIAERFPQARLVRSPDNLGFAKANNVAAKMAQGEFLLLLNPDTVVLDGAIDTLTRFAKERPEAMVWGGRTLYPDGSLNPYSCWRAMDLWNVFCQFSGLAWMFPNSAVFNTEAYGGWPRDSEREVDIVTGCFLMIRTDFWNALDGFDLTFIMYAEEADLCLRARAYGARPRITPDAVIVHYGGASEKVRADKTVRILKAKISLIKKHWSWPARPLGLFLFRRWPWTRHVAVSLIRSVRGDGSVSDISAWSEVWRRRREWREGWDTVVT